MDINDLILSDEALSVIDNGAWVDAGPEAEGVSFLVTGFQSESARKLMKDKTAKLRQSLRGKPLSDEQSANITKEVIVEAVLKDWKGLKKDGEELPYSKELACKFIMSRGGDKFLGLVMNAALQLDNSANSYVDGVTKNS